MRDDLKAHKECIECQILQTVSKRDGERKKNIYILKYEQTTLATERVNPSTTYCGCYTYVLEHFAIYRTVIERSVLSILYLIIVIVGVSKLMLKNVR